MSGAAGVYLLDRPTELTSRHHHHHPTQEEIHA